MENTIYLKAYEQLKASRKIVIARTIRRMGSAPRAVGSMCIITQEGELIGTIGGGLMEHKVLKKARQLFSKQTSCIYRFQLTQEDVAKDGMICGGDVDIYLEPVFPENKSTMMVFKILNDHLIQNKDVTLITLIADHISALDTQTRVLMLDDNTVIGEISGFNKKEIILDELNNSFKLNKPDKLSKPDKIEGSTQRLMYLKNTSSTIFVEKMAIDPCVVIFGAGHISTFLAPLAKLVGFRVVIIDDRSEFANAEKFPDADEIHAISFDQAFKQIKITKKSFVVIVTRGHLFDKTVLEFALNTDAAYIGMIGSKRKKAAIYGALMEQGVIQEELDSVHAPIGLEINAETPEEIAVSIIAQLIRKRAGEKLEKKQLE